MKLTRSFILSAFGCMLFAFISTTAAGQSDNELRRENQRLKSEVERLQKELEAAQETIAQLREQIRQLRSGGAGTGTGTLPPVEERVSIDETEPTASPRALVNFLKESYEDELGGLDPGSADSRERATYMHNLQRWAVATAREVRRPVEWRVKIESVESTGARGAVVRMIAVDPKYGTQLGSPFQARIPRNRLATIERGGLDTAYSIRAALDPEIRINEDRTSAGTFNVPPFVGQFVELILTIDVQTIVPAPVGETDDADG